MSLPLPGVATRPRCTASTTSIWFAPCDALSTLPLPAGLSAPATLAEVRAGCHAPAGRGTLSGLTPARPGRGWGRKSARRGDVVVGPAPSGVLVAAPQRVRGRVDGACLLWTDCRVMPSRSAMACHVQPSARACLTRRASSKSARLWSAPTAGSALSRSSDRSTLAISCKRSIARSCFTALSGSPDRPHPSTRQPCLTGPPSRDEQNPQNNKLIGGSQSHPLK